MPASPSARRRLGLLVLAFAVSATQAATVMATEPGIFAIAANAPATAQYSDYVTFSGTLTCTNTTGGASCPTTPATMAGSTVEALVSFNPRGPAPLGYYVVASTAVASGDCTIHSTTASVGLKATCNWSMSWQAGRTLGGVHSVAPGTFSVRFRATGGPTGNPPGSNSTKDDGRSVTINSEFTSTEYLGDLSASEGAVLNVSADVDDLDGGIGLGNGAFLPDLNLDGVGVVQFDMLTNSGCSGSFLTGVSADVDQNGMTISSPTLDLTGIAPGTYYLMTAYNGTLVGFYAPSDDCDQITIEAADSMAPTDASIVINEGDPWTNNPNVTVDVSANDDTGVDFYRLAESQLGLDSAADVEVSPDDPTFSAADVAFSLTAGDAASKVVWLRVCDAAGHCTDTLDTIGLDQTAPVISDDGPTARANGNGWYNADVTNAFLLDADISGPDAACAAAFPSGAQTKTTSGEGFALKVTSDSCTDQAGNTASGVTSANFQVDQSAPTTITFSGGGISEGDSYYFGSVPAGPSGCDAYYDISGSAGCVVSGPSNGNAVGPNHYTAAATDRAGNTGYQNVNYTVLAWTLSGFRPPVDMGGVPNVVKGGSTVPLKFEVFAGALELTDVGDIDEFMIQEVGCMSLENVLAEIGLVTTGGTWLRYNGVDGHFIQNWTTPKLPGRCYRVMMWTDDGSSLSALFELR